MLSGPDECVLEIKAIKHDTKNIFLSEWVLSVCLYWLISLFLSPGSWACHVWWYFGYVASCVNVVCFCVCWMQCAFVCVCVWAVYPLAWLFRCGMMVGFVLIFAPVSMRNTKTIGFLINDTGSEKCLYFPVTVLQQRLCKICGDIVLFIVFWSQTEVTLIYI